MESRHKEEMMRTLDILFSKKVFNDRAVLLFGHCNATEEMADYLMSRGACVEAILDNSISKQGLSYIGIPIVSPMYIDKCAANSSVVLIATRFFAEMSEQLRRMNYTGEIIQVVEYNSFAEYSLSEETFERKKSRMYRGLNILNKIRGQYSLHHVVLCPNNALGDVYWAMAFLPAYCKKNAFDKVAVAVVGNACKQVVNMFGIYDVVDIDEAQMDELVQSIIFTQEPNCIIAHHDRPYTDNIIKWLDRHFLPFIDYYKYAVYGLSNAAQPVWPSNMEAFSNLEQMPKGKAVILSPYAKSVVELPREFWDRIVSDYKEKGFFIYTNTVGDEKPIGGTLPLNIPIRQMADAVSHAGTFIGIRSGLCDIVYKANCRKIVVFPDCYYSTTPYKVVDFFKLPEWETIMFE